MQLHLLDTVFILVTIIQLTYYWGIFGRILISNKSRSHVETNPGISIVVCAHNEAQNLKSLIDNLLLQEYPKFEIIIVDDRSEDNTQQILQSYSDQIKTVSIYNTPQGWTGKKYALNQGINNAKFDYILLTDADCVPASSLWIKEMSSKLSEADIVLGISPYLKCKGLLNYIIQFETLHTALLYTSFAIAKLPYMGVGRNLLYHKEVYEDYISSHNHSKVLGGDDDLLINSIASKYRIATCLNQSAYTLSIPENSFVSWLSQKHRHISVSRYYTTKSKLLLGVYHLTNLLFYALLLWLLFSNRLDLVTTTGLFLRTASQIVIFGFSAKILKMRTYLFFTPILDFSFVWFNCFFGIYASLKKRKTWR